jgi:lysophospholipase L1-like esterase
MIRPTLFLAAIAVFFIPGISAADTNASPPTLFLIGDSTVKNGSGKGDGGLWGWGNFIGNHFDTNRITLKNKAIGGRSSRTFLTEGRWDEIQSQLKPGDFVIMQFGHNDGGELARGDRPRASLKGDGDESREVAIEKTGRKETVHTYGWYLRKYISDTKARGATPVVCSPIPRNIWRNGKVARASNAYGKWAEEAARQGSAFFIDLNEIIAQRYDELGQAFIATNFFTATDHTHTTRAGAEENAVAVVRGISKLEGCSLQKFLLPQVTR